MFVIVVRLLTSHVICLNVCLKILVLAICHVLFVDALFV
jgi:hypothetical protein